MNLKSNYNEVAKFLIEKHSRVCRYRNKLSTHYPHGMAIEAEV